MRNFRWHKVTPNADTKLINRFGAGFRKLVILKRTLKKISVVTPWQRILPTACECAGSTVREIKLVTDFIHLLLNKENLQNCVFVVEDNFKKISNLKKRPFQFA